MFFRIGEVEDTQKKILELMKRMREGRERKRVDIGGVRKDRTIKVKEKVWNELEKEARLYERDPEELAGMILESNYILKLKGEEYED